MVQRSSAGGSARSNSSVQLRPVKLGEVKLGGGGGSNPAVKRSTPPHLHRRPPHVLVEVKLEEGYHDVSNLLFWGGELGAVGYGWIGWFWGR